MITKQCWVKLIIPPSSNRMMIAQEAARNIAQECGFSSERISFIELAIEETIGTILRHVTDDDDIDDARLHIEIKVEAPLLRLSIVNKGLPFDPTDISEYDAAQIELMMGMGMGMGEGETETANEQASTFDSELALFLLKQAVDRYQIRNAGKEGIFFELEWFLPDKHISEEAEQWVGPGSPSTPHRATHDGPRQKVGPGSPSTPHRATHDDSRQEVGPSSPSTPQHPHEPHRATHDGPSREVEPREENICVLAERDALGISQLIYRSYGDTYPHEDFYFPARLRAHQSCGRIKSWGVTTSGGKVVGHLALQKSHPDALAVEWGAVVVDPQWRSAGLMKKMLTAAIAEMEERPEMVFFVHAVTTHPFTQKTCNRFGFVPTALLFGFASDNLRFRGLQEQAVQRESMYFASRLLRPLPLQKLYPPEHHRATLERLFTSLGLSLAELTALPAPPSETSSNPEEQSLISTTIISSINIGTIDVTKIGADFATLLSRELRRLCRERVDMIYLNIDLADPLAGEAVENAESLGFFLAGWQPLQPFPYTLTLQYANTTKVDFSEVVAEGEQAIWLKEIVARERERSEKI